MSLDCPHQTERAQCASETPKPWRALMGQCYGPEPVEALMVRGRLLLAQRGQTDDCGFVGLAGGNASRDGKREWPQAGVRCPAHDTPSGSRLSPYPGSTRAAGAGARPFGARGVTILEAGARVVEGARHGLRVALLGRPLMGSNPIRLPPVYPFSKFGARQPNTRSVRRRGVAVSSLKTRRPVSTTGRHFSQIPSSAAGAPACRGGASPRRVVKSAGTPRKCQRTTGRFRSGMVPRSAGPSLFPISPDCPAACPPAAGRSFELTGQGGGLFR